MSSVLVGAGGWAYFQVPGKDSLRAYSSSFDFVEVNSTYYEYPELQAVSGWRSRVPGRFHFSVRCHREIADAFRKGEEKRSEAVVGRMEEICRILDADILTILIPQGLVIAEENLVSGISQAVSTFGLKNTEIAIELRDGASPKVLKTMQQKGVIHCVDISRAMPAYDSRTLYSRLFGKGQDNIYQFDDEEIKEIGHRATEPRFEKSILAFHGVRMFGDAARLKAFMKSGKFLQVSGQTGLDSLGEVLKEDATFPASKTRLVAEQGWKLFDLTKDKRVRAANLLQKLPQTTFANVEEVMASLQNQFPQEARSVTRALVSGPRRTQAP